MAKPRKTPGSIRIAPAVRAELDAGNRESSNLMEALAVDFAALMSVAVPNVPKNELRRFVVGAPSITQRMLIAGQLCVEHVGVARLDQLSEHSSDTVRGWAAYVVGLTPGLSLIERFKLIRPLANDDHFGVREWAWMPLRKHIAAELRPAIKMLEPWVHDRAPFVRRFATEATRPCGVWTEHITELKANPKLGLPLLRPLRADPEKYVQDSVANWLNDASKSQPGWVRELVESWADNCEDARTLRICKRAVRSIASPE